MPEFIGSRFTNRKLRQLKNIGRIRSLSLVDTSVNDDGIEVLEAAVNLGEIQVVSDKISDRSMRVLCGLPKLVSLLLSGVPNVTDTGISELKRTHEIMELYLMGTKLTDAGIDSFTHLANIWSLSLEGTNVTDVGVRKLSMLPRLCQINLSNTFVAGDGLTALSGEGMGLCLKGCPISDATLIAPLHSLKSIRRLDLSATHITDKSLDDIAKLGTLETLKLIDTAVTDRGIASLAGHPTLSHLDVRNTSVTSAAIDSLTTASRTDLWVYS